MTLINIYVLPWDTNFSKRHEQISIRSMSKDYQNPKKAKMCKETATNISEGAAFVLRRPHHKFELNSNVQESVWSVIQMKRVILSTLIRRNIYFNM